MASAAKQQFDQLSRPGPHRVVRGQLALIGMPGLVFTPAAGLGLPAIAFGHGYLQPAGRYTGIMKHLASWGVVVGAPDTQRGPLPSHCQFAADLRTTLDICSGVRLGDGEISVDPEKLALAGHSLGGGCAVLAAVDDPRVRGVATFAPAEALPSATQAAPAAKMPAMHVAGEEDLIAPAAGHAGPIARCWGGPVQLRTVRKATHLGFTEGRHWSELLLDGKPQHRTQRTVKALLTAFLLARLTGTKDYDALLESDVKGAPIEYQHDWHAAVA